MRGLTRWLTGAGVRLALVGVAAGIAILAVGFLSAALYLALAEALGPPLAAAATGVALIVVAALVLLGIRLSMRGARPPPETQAQPDGRASAAKLGEMLGEEAAVWTKRHPAASMLAALAAGFAVGSSPKIRSELSRLL